MSKFLDVRLTKCNFEDNLRPQLLVIITDITSSILNERLKQVEDYKNKVLETITHKLKTPINCMITVADSNLNNNSVEKL